MRRSSITSPSARFLPRSLCALALLCGMAAQQAHADLMLNPTRVVFDKNRRAAQVELVNNGSEPVTYRITLVRRRMDENGEFLPVDTPLPGELFADDLVRYAPRQVTLLPGIGQTVRIMLRKPASLADGEYRSHLQFESLPPPVGSKSIESAASKGEIGISITVLLGASIPVIVRQGVTSAEVNLGQLELKPAAAGQQPAATFEIRRSGNQSVYGDISVAFIGRDGTERLLGRASGVAVYSPLPMRKFKVPLTSAGVTRLANGTLRVRYSERPDAGGKLLGETTLALP
jgi:P pilus assembly chaperone PapD